MPNLPIGRMDEVLVHPRDHDLILATHSRSVWIMDDITALQRLTPDALDEAVGAAADARRGGCGRPIAGSATEVPGDKWWEGENAPRGTAIAYLSEERRRRREDHDLRRGDRAGVPGPERHGERGAQPLAVGSVQHAGGTTAVGRGGGGRGGRRRVRAAVASRRWARIA